MIGGWSDGVLPPQRQFAIGGLGSVHGYGFKEAVGDSLALVNLEYALGWRNGPKVFGLFDAGRVTSPTRVDAPWLKGIGVGLGPEASASTSATSSTIFPARFRSRCVSAGPSDP